MTRWLLMTAILIGSGFAGASLCRGQTPAAPAQAYPYPFDLGPGSQGATLKQPGLDTPGHPPSAPSLQKMWHPVVAPNWNPDYQPGKKIALPPSQRFDMNKDIEITPDAGPWLILVTSYSGEKAPEQARKFVAVLRGAYKLNAWVFNYGAEEKRQEYERVEAERARQREALRKEGIQNVETLAIPVRVTRIDEQTGVLIGGYRNRDEALNDLKRRIRSLKPPDPKQVDLCIQYIGQGQPDKNSKYPCTTINVSAESHAYVNPFATAFPVRNPRLPQEQTPENAAAELAYLRQVNEGEPLTLLKCKKAFTLLIKQYKTSMMMNDNPNDAKGFLERFNKRVGEKDIASQNAHNIAEGFRKVGLGETYVLHARYCSYVTVGGFDGPQDPNLVRMQNFLEERFRAEALQPLDLLAQPIPFEVPH